jgi:soluble lytic murein transglycosylase
MPQVPRYENLQAATAAAPAARFASPNAQGGEIAGNQIARAGQALMGAGQEAARQVTTDLNIDTERLKQMQAMSLHADELRVTDALNKLKEEQARLTYDPQAGFTNVKGINAMPFEGKALSDRYLGDLGKSASDIAKDLTPAQRAAFDRGAANISTAFHGQLMAHESGEFKNYALSVSDGVIQTAQREIALNWQDPTTTAKAAERIRANAFQIAQLQGKSAEWSEAMARKSVGAGHGAAVTAALDAGAIEYAQGYVKRFAADMEPDDLLRVQSRMTKELDERKAVATVGQVFQERRAQIQPTDFDKLVAITLNTESRGQRYGKDGQLLTSPKGALGEMQVMPATNRDPGFGVKPAQNDSPDELARVGRDYLGAMIKRYDGDLGKAWAAYNAGPGRLDEAIKKAEKEGPELAKRGRTADWRNYLPAETQAYVEKNLKAWETAQASRPTPPTDDELHRDIEARMAGSRPDAIEKAKALASKRRDDLVKANKEAEDRAVVEVQQELLRNGGDWSAVPSAKKANVPPGEVDNLLNYSARIRKGEDFTDPAVYAKLSDAKVLRGLSDDEFMRLRPLMSESDFKRFASDRVSIKKGADPQDLDSTAIKTVVDQQLRMLDIDPGAKADLPRIGAMRKFIDDEILGLQARAGKKLTDAELRQHVGAIFAREGRKSGWFGFSDSTAPAMTMKAGDIPSDIKDRLKADFKAAGVSSPTDAQLLGAYWRATAAVGRVKQ